MEIPGALARPHLKVHCLLPTPLARLRVSVVLTP